MNDENGWAFAYSLLKLNFCNVLHKICNIQATYSLRVYTDSILDDNIMGNFGKVLSIVYKKYI